MSTSTTNSEVISLILELNNLHHPTSLARDFILTHSFIMHFVIPFLLGLSWLANAAYIPALSTNSTEIVSRDVGGYRSVAYYVNWVCSDHTEMSIISLDKTRDIQHVIIRTPKIGIHANIRVFRLSTVVTSNPRISPPSD